MSCWQRHMSWSVRKEIQNKDEAKRKDRMGQKMKIATWNIERLKHGNRIDEIQNCCEKIGADILVLTETDSGVKLDFPYCHESLPPVGEEIYYKPTERRVSVYTRYPCIRQHETFDPCTALCVELETELGSLVVYGTVIGRYGNRTPSFLHDLRKQCEDIQKLSQLNCQMCFCGDFNCSFSDNYYFTKAGRTLLLDIFQQHNMSILTEEIPECVDHIAVSDAFFHPKDVQISEWNSKKALSDHKGVCVRFNGTQKNDKRGTQNES